MPQVFLYQDTQFFDDTSGAPLAGGKIWTYAAGTTTPLATYTDSTGSSLATNPVILDPAGVAGVAGIWLTSASYKFVIQTSAGATVRTIDGINIGTAANLSSAVTSTGDVTLQQSTAATSGANQSSNLLKIQARYWTGAADATDTHQLQNVVGAGANPTSTLLHTHAGTSGAVTFSTGAIAASGQITSTLITGTAPFSIASTTVVPNLNVSQLEGATWEVPGTIGSTTPNTVNSSGGALNGTIGATTPNTGKFTTVNKVTITTPATGSTLTIADGKTATVNNSLTLAGTDGTTQTFQASDTIVGRATTDTLSNKTLTGASSGNSTNLLNQQGPTGTLTGTSAPQTIYTYSLPANTVANGKSIHLRAMFNHNSGTASVGYGLNLNGTTLLAFSSSTAGSHVIDIDIFNTGAATGAVMELFGATSSPAGQTIGSGLAWASPQVLTLIFNVGNTDQVTGQGWKVTLDQ